MTIIDELLILLDDLEQAESQEIPRYFATSNLQVIFSSLGRLVNRGWAVKHTKRGETFYSISTHGVNELNRTLDHIKQEGSGGWDQQWHGVIFDIPEAKRRLRDNFRILLKQTGYGMLTSSVWISPWDKTEPLKRYTKRQNLQNNIFFLTTTATENYQSLMMAHRCWDWGKIDKNYRAFINRAERELRSLNEDKQLTRFRAKKLVFEYAEVVSEDPQLPQEISPNGTLVKRAGELYAKIRPYCLMNPSH